MALFWRIWVAVALVNLAVLAVFVGLATLQFATINADLVGGRLLVLADRTAQPFDVAAKLGLPLSTVRNAEALLERARQTDAAIVAVHVFDGDGRIVQSTEQPAPATIPPEALAARTAAVGAPWHKETSGGFLSGRDIAAADGRSVGGILIVYPGVASVTQIRAIAAELAIAAVGILIVAAAIGLPMLRIGLKRQIGDFTAIDDAIAAFERSSWRSAAGAPPEPTDRAGPAPELRHLLEAAEERYRLAGETITKAAGDRV